MQNATIKNSANCIPVSMASFIQIHLISLPTHCGRRRVQRKTQHTLVERTEKQRGLGQK